MAEIWRTISGRRVLIKEGQSLAEAMKESGKFKTYKKETEDKLKEGRKKLAQSYSDKELDKEINSYKDKNDEESRKRAKELEEEKKERFNKKLDPELVEEAKQMMDDIKYLDPEEEGYKEALEDIKESFKDLREREGKNQSPQSKEIEEALKQLDEENIKSKVAESSKGAVKDDSNKIMNDSIREKAGKQPDSYKDSMLTSRNDDEVIKDLNQRKERLVVHKDRYTPEEYKKQEDGLNAGIKYAEQQKENKLQGEKELKEKYMNIPEEERVKAYEEGKNWKDLVKERENAKTTKQVANEKYNDTLEKQSSDLWNEIYGKNASKMSKQEKAEKVKQLDSINKQLNKERANAVSFEKQKDGSYTSDIATIKKVKRPTTAYYGGLTTKYYSPELKEGGYPKYEFNSLNEAKTYIGTFKDKLQKSVSDSAREYLKEHPNSNKTMNELIREAANKKKKSGK